MSTTENSKMLAEFLGYTQPHPQYPNTTYWYKEGEPTLCMLAFNYDWNWLMLVVEKIESLGFIFKSRGASSTFLKKNEALIWNDEFTGNSKIQATYNACVEFVKLYNTQEV